MKKWEYKTIERSRNFRLLSDPSKWSQEIQDTLTDLGDEGWELVTVVTRSAYAGISSTGFTTDEMWVLKRPFE
jgi:hypothetical protein